jgi:hypothetical protein
VNAYHRGRSRCAAVLLLLAGIAPALAAQGTAIVATSDPAYADIDRLAELGALDSTIIGQRPYSRRELARIVRVARDRAAREDPAAVRTSTQVQVAALLARLSARFGDAAMPEGIVDAPFFIDGAAGTANSTDAPRRAFSGSITRPLEAEIDPLAERRLGVRAPEGQALAFELSHRLDLTSWLAFQATERLEGRVGGNPDAAAWNAELLLAGARLRYRNLGLRIGRQQVTWAQQAGDGLFLASDAPALDLVSLASDEPFRMPGVLRALGPTQATLLVADLGESTARSHSKLLAYKVSVLPRRSIELGATFMNHYGGTGGRASSLGNRLIDFLPFVDIFRSHNYTDTTRTLDVDSDKLLGVDARVQLARLAGLTLTTELLIDDFDVHRIPTIFTWDGAQTFGALLPSIAGTPVSVRVGAKHTGVRTYTHGLLSNGITTRGRLLGDELGPDAKAFSGGIGWDAGGPIRAALDARSAIYSKADYETLAQGTYFVIHRVGPASNELRDQLAASMTATLAPTLVITARLAGERVRNADFTGRTRHDYAAAVALRFAR